MPGPILPLFILSVGGTELWPLLAVVDAVALSLAIIARGKARVSAASIAAAALACTLAPPMAYALYGPYIPFTAFFAPIPARNRTAKADAPVVLAVYGGAWERGSPRNDARLNATIASWGYRVIALDYPHAPKSRWPTQRDAILQQIDAIHATRIAIVGHSSGAQLAMIAGALRPRRIDAIVTFASPVDLKLGYEYPSQPDVIGIRTILSDLCGGPPSQYAECYRSASPRYVVHPGMPPVLMIAGGRDHVVDVTYEHVLRDELRHDGVPVEYLQLPWADHSFETVARGFHDRIALWYLRRFLNAHLRSQDARGGSSANPG